MHWSRFRSLARTGALVVLAGGLVGCTDFGAPVVSPTPPVVTSVVILSPAGGTATLEVGRALDFTAEARDGNGAAISGALLQWTTSADSVASIDGAGHAVAHAAGTAAIRAGSAGIQSVPFVLNVGPATQVPAVISIASPQNPANLILNATLEFRAVVTDSHGDTIPGAAVQWHTSDSTVASIDTRGLARGTGVGEASITASLGALVSEAVLLQVASGAPDFQTRIQPIFDGYCIGCHGGSGGLFLDASVSYANLVNVRATGSPEGLVRVRPGVPDSSYILVKLEGPCPSPRCTGHRMPQGGVLPAPELQAIHDWIAAGAPR